jgi:hypothetical protein
MLFAYMQKKKAKTVNSTLISLQFYFKNTKEEWGFFKYFSQRTGSAGEEV